MVPTKLKWRVARDELQASELSPALILSDVDHVVDLAGRIKIMSFWVNEWEDNSYHTLKRRRTIFCVVSRWTSCHWTMNIIQRSTSRRKCHVKLVDVTDLGKLCQIIIGTPSELVWGVGFNTRDFSCSRALSVLRSAVNGVCRLIFRRGFSWRD